MKKAAIIVVVLFIGFYLLTEPVGLADVASNGGSAIWKLATQFFKAVIDFLNALVS